ncbi:chromatin remodeling complex protein [Trametes versicolor FP-101664 SS1]|uniref:chromatin remodeling complex protein n=1 Tax=Trametes versicolor (strain FP-101664) TaxID=717944 RepID=UPI00046218F8|nr:chromatin remodeling complex protein [Trametes versicolor FP-101664 SS1]EIW64756.1 chromatin remodeling complex protein [Trametes versicolor FP-101664 SS1]
MPTCRRKRVLLTEPSPALLDAFKNDPAREVFYLADTGEIFETFEAYTARMSFYRVKQFQCEVTGKSGLDYFQALESERQEARTMHSRFPDQLKAAVLKAVQWQVMGRLDHLVEAVYDRFKDRYYPDEKIYVDIQGEKYLARIIQVFPPKSNLPLKSSPGPVASTSSSPLSDEPMPPITIHKVAEDLKVPVKDSIAMDNPAKYTYKVQILDEERQPGFGKADKSKGKETSRGQWSGHLLDVDCSKLGRDRLAFSKSILRRFIRDCVDRDAAVASPWTVKPAIAARYGVSNDMPEEIRKSVETLKKGESDKRKKVWEEKEGPASKRQKRAAAAAENEKLLAAIAEQREREAREKAVLAQKAKEESERLAAEKKKKKPIRYPTEDLDVVLGDKEKRAGMKLKRPVPSKLAMPFGEDQETNSAFLMTWNFLVVYGQPLHISPFTMDDFEGALRHSVVEPPCPLLGEIHATLIYILRTVGFERHSAIVSLVDDSKEKGGDNEVFGVTIDQLTAAMADVGNNWERAPLRHSEGREGWEESLVGCLKDHATLENFPRLREILTRILFSADGAQDPISSAAPTPSNSPGPMRLTTPGSPADLYYKLPAKDRVDIITFMCNLAVSSKAIHIHMETCEEQLTALRKEKIEVNRTKKAYAEEINALSTEINGDSKSSTNGKSATEDVAMHDSSDLSEVPGSDAEDPPPKSGSTRRSAAKEREAARAKAHSARAAQAERRRLEEEVNKLERRLEGIEREFRKLLGSVRVKPLGRDRFYNRVWWFDGMGAASLIGSGGTVQYGSGRIFVQGASEFDVDVLRRREENVDARRREEEGEEGMLAVGEWAVYNDLEEVKEFVDWLNPKGVRELALKNTFVKWWNHIAPGMRRRAADLNANAKIPEARRSARKHAGADIMREPYMQWTNRKAVNGS